MDDKHITPYGKRSKEPDQGRYGQELLIGETDPVRASRELAELWAPNQELELPPMSHENHKDICEILFKARDLTPTLYEDKETKYRGWEFEANENLPRRGTIVISMGWRAPEWFATDLIKELTEQGYRVMVASLPGYGMNYREDVNFQNEDIVKEYGNFLKNYKMENDLRDDDQSLPTIQMPMSLASRSVVQYLAQAEGDEFGNAIYFVEPALWLNAMSDKMARSFIKESSSFNKSPFNNALPFSNIQLKRLHLRERVFAWFDRLTTPIIGYKYEGLGRAMQNASAILGREVSPELGMSLRKLYLDLESPENNLQMLRNKGIAILGAISGGNDEVVDVGKSVENLEVKFSNRSLEFVKKIKRARVKEPFNNIDRYKVVEMAAHSLETASLDGKKSNLMDNIDKILTPLNSYADHFRSTKSR